MTDMRGAFCTLKNFNCDLSNWDVSNVEYTDFMFEGCTHFKSDIDCWVPLLKNIKSVTYMFADCKDFDMRQYIWRKIYLSGIRGAHSIFERGYCQDLSENFHNYLWDFVNMSMQSSHDRDLHTYIDFS